MTIVEPSLLTIIGSIQLLLNRKQKVVRFGRSATFNRFLNPRPNYSFNTLVLFRFHLSSLSSCFRLAKWAMADLKRVPNDPFVQVMRFIAAERCAGWLIIGTFDTWNDTSHVKWIAFSWKETHSLWHHSLGESFPDENIPHLFGSQLLAFDIAPHNSSVCQMLLFSICSDVK